MKKFLHKSWLRWEKENPKELYGRYDAFMAGVLFGSVVDNYNDTTKCKEEGCDNLGQPLHTCPYNETLGDGQLICNCCDSCEQFCSDSI